MATRANPGFLRNTRRANRTLESIPPVGNRNATRTALHYQQLGTAAFGLTVRDWDVGDEERTEQVRLRKDRAGLYN